MYLHSWPLLASFGYLCARAHPRQMVPSRHAVQPSCSLSPLPEHNGTNTAFVLFARLMVLHVAICLATLPSKGIGVAARGTCQGIGVNPHRLTTTHKGDCTAVLCQRGIQV